MPGIFDGIKSAKARIDSNYVRPAHFIARINKCKIGKSRKDESFFTVEMTVVHDCEPERYERGTYGHAVGEDVSHMMMAKHDSFLSNVKAFASNVPDISEDQIGEDEMVAICADDQPLAGTFVEVVARNIKTRKGTDFTSVSYKGEVPRETLRQLWEKNKEKGEELIARYLGDAEAAAT